MTIENSKNGCQGQEEREIYFLERGTKELPGMMKRFSIWFGVRITQMYTFVKSGRM